MCAQLLKRQELSFSVPSVSSLVVSFLLVASFLVPSEASGLSAEECFGTSDPVPDGVIESAAADQLQEHLLEAGPKCAPALMALLEKQPTGVLSEVTIRVVTGWNDSSVLPLLYEAFAQSQLRPYGRNEDLAFAMAQAIASLLGPDADLLGPLRRNESGENWLDFAATRYLEEWKPELSTAAHRWPAATPQDRAILRDRARVFWHDCLEGRREPPTNPFDPLALQSGPSHDLALGTRCASQAVLEVWLQAEDEGFREQVRELVQRYSQTGDLNQLSITLEKKWGQKIGPSSVPSLGTQRPEGPELRDLSWVRLCGGLFLFIGLLSLRPSKRERSEGLRIQWPWQRRWWLRFGGQLLGLTVGCAVLLALEMACRLAGVPPGDEVGPGRDLSFMLVDGSGEEQWVQDSRFRLFPKTPKAGTARIAFIGASTVAGPGLAEQETLSSRLQEDLKNEVPCLEVLNLGHHGFASPGFRALTLFALDELEADLVVLYGGHNEVASMREQERFLDFNPTGYRARSWLLRSHLVGLLRPLFHTPHSAPTHAEQQERGEDEDDVDWVSRHSPDFERAVTLRFERELTDIVRAVHRRSRTLLLVQPSFNHHGLRVGPWHPAGKTPPSVTADQVIDQLEQGAAEDAISSAEALVTLDPGHPTPWCLLALARELGGDLLGAEEAVWECARRNQGGSAVTPGVADQIAAVASRYDVPLADAHAALHAASGGHLPGFNLFTDYVHLNQRGAEIVTTSISETLRTTGLVNELSALCPSK